MKRSNKLRRLLCLCLCLCTAVSFLTATAPRLAMAQEQEEVTRRVVTVSTAEEFLELAGNCRLDSYSIGLTVVLEDDIDLSGISFDGIPTFGGIFDGAGNSITGLSLSGAGSVQGLFRYLGETAVVRDLLVSGEIIPSGSRDIIGAIAGSNSGTIRNCVFSGRVSGSDYIGGLVGCNELTGTVENCRVSGDIHGDHFVGGIAGQNYGVIRGCENKAQVNTTAEQNDVDISDITLESLLGSESAITVTDIGGIAGTSSGVVRDCINLGNVGYRHMGYNIGGIAGSQMGYITGCENFGDVAGRKEVGGIVGQMEPSTEIAYESDTMQILKGQLGEMSQMINSTTASMQGGAEAMQSQIGSMREHIGSALDAMDQLMPDPSEPGLPDADTTLAALSNLSGSLTALSGSLSSLYQTGQDTVNDLTGNFEEIIGQLNTIGATVGAAGSELGGVITDVSDEDTEETLTGKVADCVNSGSVTADLNAGGIAGAMSIENDLDPEGDFYITGESSMNYECRARAVILRCENRGAVTAGKQNSGGIVGWMLLGLVSDSMNTGALDSSNADYVGGIAGRSLGFIRNCGAKCEIRGAEYTGGIAGTGAVITDCRSMVDILAGSEKIGAVVGWYGDNISPEGEELPLRGNYYLVSGKDIGAIDGISYDGVAQGLPRTEFYSLEGLPESFRNITVSFIYDDGSVKEVLIASGGRLTLSDIPPIPDRNGYYGYWDGLEEVGLGTIGFDAAFTLTYSPLSPAIQSTQTDGNGMPLVLAQGAFVGKRGMELVSVTDVPVSEEAELLNAWSFTLPESDSAVQLRYLIGADVSPDNLRIMLRDSDGEWRQAAYTVNGSYAVFPVAGGDDAFSAELVKESYLAEIILASAGALVLIGAAAVLIAAKRRKKTADKTDE